MGERRREIPGTERNRGDESGRGVYTPEREAVQRRAEIDGIVRGGQKIRDARIHRGFAASDG